MSIDSNGNYVNDGLGNIPLDNPTYLTAAQLGQGGGSASSSGPNWGQMLLTGVSAAIDSQLAQPYGLNNPVYNSQYGPGGVGQYPPGTTFDVYGNPILPRSVTNSGGTILGLSPIMLLAFAALLFVVMRKR